MATKALRKLSKYRSKRDFTVTGEPSGDRGEFSATATFAKKTLQTKGGTDIYTAAFDSKGALEWLIPNGGAKGDNAYTMAWHPTGRLAIAGACVAPSTFGAHTMSAPGAAEAYAAVLRVP